MLHAVQSLAWEVVVRLRNGFTWVLALALVVAACGGPLDEGFAGDDEFAAIEEGATAKVNVNTASVAELAALPGMNTSIASGVVAKRPWFVMTTLTQVPGLTTAIYNGIRATLTVGPTCGGRQSIACTGATTCMKRTTSARSSGVCVAKDPVVSPVSLVAYNSYSIFAHDPNARYAHRVVYGYTDRSAGDFAAASDKGSFPWYRDFASRTPGNLESVFQYVTPTPPGYYIQVNQAVSVPPQGQGVLFRVIYKCRGIGGDRDCDEGPITYRAVGSATKIEWAGNWGWRAYYPGTGRGGLLPEPLHVGATGHYPSSLSVEFWVPGLTDKPYADVGVRAELETDLWFDSAPNHPAPGGPMQHYAMQLGEREGNNWRAVIKPPVFYQRGEWNQTYHFRVRLTADDGQTWSYVGIGDGPSANPASRSLMVGTACVDGTTAC